MGTHIYIYIYTDVYYIGAFVHGISSNRVLVSDFYYNPPDFYSGVRVLLSLPLVSREWRNGVQL